MKNSPPLFNDQIISMYSFGMSTRDIQRHLQQVYGVEVSAAESLQHGRPIRGFDYLSDSKRLYLH